MKFKTISTLRNFFFSPLEPTDLSEARSSSIEWFYDTWKDNETGTGWAHYASQENVTTWGGTQDGVRALVELNEDLNDRRIQKSLRWLKDQQQEDGGWGSWAIQKSCVEATSWGLITLKKAGEPTDSEAFQDGVEFLLDVAKRRDQKIAWGAFDGAESRVYPTLLAIWALNDVEDDVVESGAAWLLEAVNDDGGWGFKPGEKSNVAMTAMVLYVLRITNSIPSDSEYCSEAQKWLLAEQKDDGTWENVVEQWICYIDPETGKEVPDTTDHFTSPWAILALLEADVSLENGDLLRAIVALAEMQEEDGSIIFNPDDPKKHTWCVANGAIAIQEAQDRFVSSSTFSTFGEYILAKRLEATGTLLKVNIAVLYTAIIILALYASGVFDPVVNQIAILIGSGVSYLWENIDAVLLNIFAAVVLGVLVFFVNRFRKRLRRKLMDE